MKYKDIWEKAEYTKERMEVQSSTHRPQKREEEERYHQRNLRKSK